MNAILYDSSIYAAKTAIVLVFLILLYRLVGKREVGQMNVYDLVMVVALANSVQNAMTGGKGDIWVGIASSSTLVLIGWLASQLFVRAPKMERWFVGSPTLLVYDGHVLEDRLKKQQVSLPELEAAMHGHGLTNVDQVGMAVLEVDGSISIVPAGQGAYLTTELA